MPPPSPMPYPPPPLDGTTRRFVFANGVDGLWMASGTPYANLTCAAGGHVYFYWHTQHHDLRLMASAAHLDSCNFTGSQTLVGTGQMSGGTQFTSYFLPCETPGATMHLSCSVGLHCLQGNQRLTVTVSDTARVFDASGGSLLVHSQSLDQVYRLLGRRYDAPASFPSPASNVITP